MTPFKPGDLVIYAGPGVSALDGGPGEVVESSGDVTLVRVLQPCLVAGNQIRRGEELCFSTQRLVPKGTPYFGHGCGRGHWGVDGSCVPCKEFEDARAEGRLLTPVHEGEAR